MASSCVYILCDISAEVKPKCGPSKFVFIITSVQNYTFIPNQTLSCEILFILEEEKIQIFFF